MTPLLVLLFGIAPATAVGAMPGIWLGSTLSARVPDRLLRSGLASVLAIIGGKLAL